MFHILEKAIKVMLFQQQLMPQSTAEFIPDTGQFCTEAFQLYFYVNFMQIYYKAFKARLII